MADITKLRPEEHQVVDAFHKLYYPLFSDTKWMGMTAAKCPFDLFVYQEIIHELRPDLIIEGGTYDGGSAIFMASICELIGHGEIVTIDVDGRQRPQAPRVSYWTGSTVSSETIEHLERLVDGKKTVLVILDDDHSRDHVLQEMHLYGRFVTPGSYLIVEDTNVNGHPVLNEFGPGPMEAVERFLQENSDFRVDRSREKFLVSFNPAGFLLKNNSETTSNSVQRSQSQVGFADKSRLLNQQLARAAELEVQLSQSKSENADLRSLLEVIQNSVGWKLLQRCRKLKEVVLPAESSLRKRYERSMRRWRISK